jgi:hypothetical protein
MKSRLIAAFVFCYNVLSSHAQDIPPTTSLVYPGIDGRLLYVADSLGNKFPIFLMQVIKVVACLFQCCNQRTVWPLPGNNADNVQAAIDRVAALPLDATGFRGAVLLKMGTFKLEKPITIKASGIVLRGEGMSDIGTILIGELQKETQGPPFRRPALININGPSGITPLEETKQIISDKYVPVGARILMLFLLKLLK